MIFVLPENKRKILQSELDELRAQRNTASKAMAQLDHGAPEFQTAREKLRDLSQDIKKRETAFHEVEAAVMSNHLLIPNAPHTSVPVGNDETANEFLHDWGNKPQLSFAPLPHWDIGERLGILDFQAAARISGARFCVLRGWGAKLNRALVAFMLDVHAERGYEEMHPLPWCCASVWKVRGSYQNLRQTLFILLAKQNIFCLQQRKCS